MKSAEEWADALWDDSESKGGWDSEQDAIPILKQIQLDAMREGMKRAAEVVRKEYPSGSLSWVCKTIDTAAEQLTEMDLK